MYAGELLMSQLANIKIKMIKIKIRISQLGYGIKLLVIMMDKVSYLM